MTQQPDPWGFDEAPVETWADILRPQALDLALLAAFIVLAMISFKRKSVPLKFVTFACAIGYIFWTTDLVPHERAYHGPIHMLVGMNTSGIINVVMDYNSEPYGYFSIDPPEFVAQLKNKSIRDPFQVGKDIAAVSRASITMNGAARALRDASRAFAKAYLSPDQVKQ